ncbi:hypothetical protein A6A06_09595 [Streptomyces sp. CB02923]|uniref:hypothetical protein n=1 Tax=Streptomyces sp. CB02923 TaxID=1718985 RepID=UPI00093AF686|nr:hypothetical protein [Streptomyces sp. CB02923]OKI04938.1 hypothetical protein A6A06_09595 [Streptomyces sp. CB02923]
MSETTPEGGALTGRADELKVKAAQAEEKAKQASAWAVRLMSALGEGTGLLGRRLTDRLKGWCLEAHRSDLTGLSADLGIYVRGALLLGAGASLCWLVYRHSALMWPLAVGWSLAALRAKVSADKAKSAKEAPADGSPEGAGKRAPGPSPEAFVHLLHDLVETCSEGGKITPGLHHAQVVAALSSRYPGRAWKAADSRALCEAAGVPLTRGTRATGPGASRGASTGVRTRDLPARPPHPSPGPSPEGAQGPGVAVVSAGQIEQQVQQQQQQQPPDNAFAFVQDESNPARWHVA